MPRYHRKVYRLSYRQPSLLNTLLFRFKNINPFTRLEFPMPTSRRNVLIRTVATITGDIACGVAMASVALWIIETAALGLFLSFLVWLIAAIAALALSQFVVHPACKILMSDEKLDMAVNALSGLADQFSHYVTATLQQA
jgi:hypothetical protein